MSGTSPPDWDAIKPIFLEAIELGPDERDAFLASACGDDASLRSEVESLLAAHHDEQPFLDASPVAGAAQVLSAAIDETEARVALLPHGTRIGQYEVLEPLGSGGMGDVYCAHDTKLDRLVALKIVLDSGTHRTADRVLREGRAASALNHPNICTLYEVGEFGSRPYLAMEYIDGQPLSSAIPPEGFEPADVVSYGVQIADALAHAHERGVIHRDLKAANVVVTPQGRAKVLDFGIAKRLTTVGVGIGTGTLTEAGTISGTLAYMAPERLRDRPANAQSDIWALGVLLYEMASGRRPFAGDSAFEVSSAILKDSPPPLPARVPAPLQNVILKCLERDPANRLQQASDVVATLKRHEDARRFDLRSIRPARRVVLGLTVAALLVAAFTVYQWPRGGSRSSAQTRLAVLPFTVLSGTQDIDYLGTAVPDNIIGRVALVRSIRVTAALVRGKENDDAQVTGRKLDVEYVLTGTIQKVGDRIRITPRLVRVEDAAVIPTPSSTLSSSDLLRLQDEIARGINGSNRMVRAMLKTDRYACVCRGCRRSFCRRCPGRGHPGAPGEPDRPGNGVTRMIVKRRDPDPVLLGSFEEQVMLAVVRTGDEAYGMNVRRELEAVTGREVTIGSVYATLDRLEEKGFVFSSRASTADAASRRVFGVTRAGARSLSLTREMRERLWTGVSLRALKQS